MPSLIRATIDLCAPHCHGGLPSLNGSPNVIVNGYPVVRKGDDYGQVTTCGGDPHTLGVAITGSSSVFANGRPVHRTGDGIACQTVAGIGSANVFAN